MKAICVQNERDRVSAFNFKGESTLQKFDLTIGKVYDIQELQEFAPRILPKKCIVIDDFRKNIHAPFDFFKPIEQYRDEQIQEILK
jgi:hypothetical protein